MSARKERLEHAYGTAATVFAAGSITITVRNGLVIGAVLMVLGVLIAAVTGIIWQTKWADREPLPKSKKERPAPQLASKWQLTHPSDIEWWKRWGPDSIALRAELSPDDFARMHHFELPVDKDTEIANLKAEVKRLLADKDAAAGVINTQVVKLKAHGEQSAEYEEHIANLKASVASAQAQINDLCKVIESLQSRHDNGEIDRIEITSLAGKVTHRLTNGALVPVDKDEMPTRNFPGWRQNYGDFYGNDSFPESQQLGA